MNKLTNKEFDQEIENKFNEIMRMKEIMGITDKEMFYHAFICGFYFGKWNYKEEDGIK